jgi:hypothetical protein
MLPQIAPGRSADPRLSGLRLLHKSARTPHGRVLVAAAVVLLALTAAWCSFGQAPQAIVKAKMVLATGAVHSGSAAHATVIAQITPGYHINDHHPTLSYLIPTELKFAPEKQFTVENVSYPKGKLQKFAFADQGLSVYEGQLVIPALLRVASGVAPGDYALKGMLSYQACNANACFPPANAAFSLPIHVTAH